MHGTAVRSQLVRGNEGMPEIVIVRKVDEVRQCFVAEEDTELLPDHISDVALHAEQLLGLSAQQATSGKDVAA